MSRKWILCCLTLAGSVRGVLAIPRLSSAVAAPKTAVARRGVPAVKVGATSVVEGVGRALRRAKRRQFALLSLARVGCVLLCPIAVALAGLTGLATLVVLALRIATLGFLLRDVSAIVGAVYRVALGLVLASLVGLVSPPFAVFGFAGAATVAAAEMAEPLLRIKYAGEVRRLKHLLRLARDPVLLDTLGLVLRSASVVGGAAARSGKRFGRSSGADARHLVESLLADSGATGALKSASERLPPAASAWSREQFETMRRSGALDAAAARALDALRTALVSGAGAGGVDEAVALVGPYVQALADVRRQQLKKLSTSRKR